MENTTSASQPPLEQPVTSVPQDPVVSPPSVLPQDSPKSRKPPAIIIGCIIFILVIILAVAFLFGSANGFSSKKLKPTPSVNIPTITNVPSPTINPFIELTLEKGKTVAIPNSDVTIQYIGASIPNPKCFDCESTTDLILTRKDVQNKLNFTCGGIAGKCTETLSGFALDIVLGEITDKTVNVKIKKK